MRPEGLHAPEVVVEGVAEAVEQSAQRRSQNPVRALPRISHDNLPAPVAGHADQLRRGEHRVEPTARADVQLPAIGRHRHNRRDRRAAPGTIDDHRIPAARPVGVGAPQAVAGLAVAGARVQPAAEARKLENGQFRRAHLLERRRTAAGAPDPQDDAVAGEAGGRGHVERSADRGERTKADRTVGPKVGMDDRRSRLQRAKALPVGGAQDAGRTWPSELGDELVWAERCDVQRLAPASLGAHEHAAVADVTCHRAARRTRVRNARRAVHAGPAARVRLVAPDLGPQIGLVDRRRANNSWAWLRGVEPAVRQVVVDRGVLDAHRAAGRADVEGALEPRHRPRVAVAGVAEPVMGDRLRRRQRVAARRRDRRAQYGGHHA